METPFPRMRTYLYILLAVLFLGTMAIMLAEGLPLFDAFYFVVVTIATVGYGDIVPTSIYGKAVAVFLILAGVGTFIAIFSEVLSFRDKIRELPAVFSNDHLIICGLHETTDSLVQQFRREKTRTVVIGGKNGAFAAEHIPGPGTVMLSGDPKDPAVLSFAQLERARALLALTDSDGLNAEIALSAMKILEKRKGKPLPCILQISNPGLWKMIREQALTPGTSSAVRLDFYNGPALGAQVLIDTYFTPKLPAWSAKPSLLIVVGAGRLGEKIITRASREWFENGIPSSVLHIVLIDVHADAVKARLLSTSPHLKNAVNIHALPWDVQSPEFQAPGVLKEFESFSYALAFICLPDDSAGLTAALILSHHLIEMKAEIHVRIDHNPGLARLVQERPPETIQIIPFNSLSIASRSDLVLGGIREILARAIHDQYLATLSLHEPVQVDSAAVPWDYLPERFKESNRLQAEGILEKVRAIGCDIVPMTDWTATGFAFTPDEIEHLAEMEHVRWMDAMKKQGFSFGPVKDSEGKTHPAMIPYAELPEPEKEKDRDTVRMIPRYLALIDFQVYRLQKNRAQGRGDPLPPHH
jgi:voltage-gated potassium channel Kch